MVGMNVIKTLAEIWKRREQAKMMSRISTKILVRKAEVDRNKSIVYDDGRQ